MAETNRKVIELWSRGESATNHRRSLYAMDNGSLWSYNLKIGQRTTGGVKIVANYTAGGEYRSQTTSCHVNLAKAQSTQIWHPKVWKISKFNDTEEIPF